MNDGMCLLHSYREVLRRTQHGENVLYVQGKVTNPALGRSFLHAWVETDNDEVIDPTTDIIMPKDEYYSIYNPTNIIKIEEPIMVLLCAKGHEFFTESQVRRAIDIHNQYLKSKSIKTVQLRKKKRTKAKPKRKVCRCKK
jgi:hypothetical protein